MPRWAIGLLGCGGLIALLLVALLVVAIVSGTSSTTAPSNQQQGQEQTSGTNKTANKAKSDSNSVEVGVGETATLRDRTFTVNDVQRDFKPQNRFNKTQPGNEFVLTAITLKNTGNDTIHYNINDFKMQDSNGVQKNGETMTELPNRIDFGELAPGGTLQGNLVFQAPQGDSNLKLVYQTDIFTKQTVTVDI